MPQNNDKLSRCCASLLGNGFDAYCVDSLQAARELFLATILPGLKVKSAAWGDSLTLHATGILEALKGEERIELIETFADDVEPRELLERRRQALLSDLFLTGSNAITERGQLINLDMIGNRIAPLSFGPKKVIVFAGRNKLVETVEQGMQRIKTLAAPLNTERHAMSTPCARSGRCHDCNSPQRICNSWSIIEKSFPQKRIKVILIDSDIGL